MTAATQSDTSLRKFLLKNQIESKQQLAAEQAAAAKRKARLVIFNEAHPTINVAKTHQTTNAAFEARFDSSLTTIEEVPGT